MSDRRRVIGLDLSLSATGVAYGLATRATITTKSSWPIGERLNLVLDVLHDAGHFYDLAVIEDLPTHAHGAGKTGMVHGVVRHHLWNYGVPVLTVPPATLKVWATGKGNCGKPDMRMELFKRLEIDEPDDNRVDAVWLWTLGAHVLGDPVLSLPQTHTRALDKLDLTALEAA